MFPVNSDCSSMNCIISPPQSDRVIAAIPSNRGSLGTIPNPALKDQDFLAKQDFPASPRSLAFSRRCPLSELEFLAQEFPALEDGMDSRTRRLGQTVLHRPRYSVDGLLRRDSISLRLSQDKQSQQSCVSVSQSGKHHYSGPL